MSKFWSSIVNQLTPYTPGEQPKLDGLITLKTTLPCGWDHWCLIHRQASLERMVPGEPFYLLDDDSQPIPHAFHPMLAKSLAVPILPEWTEYLWISGRLDNLIQPLVENCYGMAGWSIDAKEEAWEAIITKGLKEEHITFSALPLIASLRDRRLP